MNLNGGNIQISFTMSLNLAGCKAQLVLKLEQGDLTKLTK